MICSGAAVSETIFFLITNQTEIGKAGKIVYALLSCNLHSLNRIFFMLRYNIILYNINYAA